jgi:5-methylcytosine-specific restriction endonuclease McrA
VSQRRFLIARDGPNCKLCSVTIMRPHPNAQYRDHRRTDEGWLYMDLRWVPIAGEVDHVKPLWALIGMSREQLVWFFGPENLQLICRQCHAGKTKTEAGRRAHHKRLRTVEKKKSSTMKSRGFDKTLTRRFDGTITRRIK